MRTRLQCLKKAAYCERLAQTVVSPAIERLLLEAAEQWRHLSDGPTSEYVYDEADVPRSAARHEALIAWLLSQSGALIR